MSADLEIEYLPLGALKPYSRNARTHSRKQIRQIADSIKAFGFTNPILIDNQGMVLAGHGRLEAAKLLLMERVPCVRLEGMTQSQKQAYILADNKVALNAGWDEELLATELKELASLDVNFEIGVTGFSISEIDGLIEGLSVEEPASPRDEYVPRLAAGNPVTKIGDVWVMGRHRLICGDSQSPHVISRLMAGAKAQMVFTDPPYNLPIDGHVSGLGRSRHREFPMASGEMSAAQFIAFLENVCRNLVSSCTDGAIHFLCMDWRHIRELIEAGLRVYGELKNIIVWDKGIGGMGTFYRSRHEMIAAFKQGTAPHINSFELGQHGRYRTNVWSYRGLNSFGGDRSRELMLHPTVKPVAMVADAIKDVSRRGGIVLDVFAGSGSTLIAAHKTGRRAYVSELDPRYCDAIVDRWQAYAGEDAVHEESGLTFDELSRRRSAGPMAPSKQPDFEGNPAAARGSAAEHYATSNSSDRADEVDGFHKTECEKE
jgi:DNA modification methylase